MSQYILLTVAHNESSLIEDVIKSVKEQTKRPKLWLIVDDDSSDGTWEKIESTNSKWIYTRRKKRNGKPDLNHLGKIITETSNDIIKIAQNINCEWTYLGVLDADALPDKNYFENLSNEMDKKNIGIGSGILVQENNSFVKSNHDSPWGAATLYSKECLEKINYLSPTIGRLSVETALAQANGFPTNIVEGIKFKHLRQMGGKNGIYEGYKKIGATSRWLGIPYSFALVKSLKFLFTLQFKKSLGFIYGYWKWGNIKCEIEEVKKAYNERWRKWWNYSEK